MNKKELRELYLEKRAKLSPSERALIEQRVSEQFFAGIDVSNARLVHHYMRFGDEFDPRRIVEGIRARKPSVQFAVPRIYKNNLEHILVKATTRMQENKWGIPEPVVGDSVTAGSIDIVLVPLLCFDQEGHRVGYGGGYYDRFLADCRPNCLKIGLSFFPPVSRIEGVHENDVALDVCLHGDRH